MIKIRNSKRKFPKLLDSNDNPTTNQKIIIRHDWTINMCLFKKKVGVFFSLGIIAFITRFSPVKRSLSESYKKFPGNCTAGE